MRKATELNLLKTLPGENTSLHVAIHCMCHIMLELGIEDGHQVVVADVTTPKPVTLTIKYVYNME